MRKTLAPAENPSTEPMNPRMKIAAAAALVLALTTGLSACGTDTAQSDAQSSQSSLQSEGSSIPEVDRNGTANFPEVTGGFGEDPQIFAGQGQAPSTVAVKTIHQGEGAEISIVDSLVVNYELALWDGTKIESSFENGRAALFSLQEVIPGWTYALEKQHVGDRVEIVVPAKWGYGDRASGQIPAGSTLVFVVDVIDSSANVVIDESLQSQGTPTGEALPEGVKVEGDPGVEPTVSFVEGASAPSGNSRTLLVQGAGKTIVEGDYVLYRAVGGPFGSNEQINSSWALKPQLINAMQADLVGQSVGSRLVFVLGAGTNEQQGAIPTLIVLDIVGILTVN